jgi:adenosine kinase
MPALICGSLAFDTITTFPGRFADQIMPDQVHILNVSFLVPTLRREFGGCAGNIAYNLQALGGQPVILGALGVDGGDYLARVQGWGADVSLIYHDAQLHTAQCHITTDRDNNQIAAFHPGAMSQRPRNGRAAQGPAQRPGHRHHRAGRPRCDVAARAPDGRAADPLHLRPRPAAAAVQRRRAPRDPQPGHAGWP